MRSPSTPEQSPAEQILAQLSRQKWAVDTRDLEALRRLYAVDSTQVIHHAGPEGRVEIARSSNRDQIIGGIEDGWAATADTWYRGQLIHLIGSQVIEPIDDMRMRCRSYAAILGLDPAAEPVLKGYATYDDVWSGAGDEWLLAHREAVLYGHRPSGR